MAGYKNAMSEKRSFKNIALGALRSLGAYLAASYAAGIVMTMSFFLISLEGGENATTVTEVLTVLLVGSLLPTLYIVFFAAIPAMVFVLIARLTKAPRGWLDILVAAIIGPLLLRLMSMSLSTPNLIDLVFLTAGGVAGWTYWYLAGRPSPPYSRWFDPD